MTQLEQERCLACEGGIKPLKGQEAQSFLAKIKGWTINSDDTEISQTFKFKNYYHTMAFVNAIAWVSHAENHHPDLEVSYNSCRVRYSTHAILGLSKNDFICAAKVDALAENIKKPD